AIRAVAPDMKFVGVSLAFPSKAADFFEYFLDAKHHRAGIPLDAISYHFYAVPTLDQTPDVQQVTFFEQADKFLDIVGYIEQIRQRLSPRTTTMINEIGSISADDLRQGEPGYKFTPIPQSYWNLSGAMYAYIFSELSRIGIDVAGESQLVGFPTQFPSVSMVDWTDGRPNARYWVLKLLHDHFGPGDKLVATQIALPGNQAYVHAQGFVTRDGKRKLLLVNKRDRAFEIALPGAPARVDVVDQTTAFEPPASRLSSGATLKLEGFSVTVVTWP
ncbi:MAG: glycosyl hydrolase family 39, partial [Actinomycetota bacterium]|nr:glycosyl hydrolase family 39 [Actinomycetota bacterium]